MEKMNNKRRLIGILACVLITGVGYFLIYYDSIWMFINEEETNFNIPAAAILFDFFDGMSSIIPTILFLLLIPFLLHSETNLFKIYGYDKQIILRSGWNKFFFSKVAESIREIWYFPILINLLIIALTYIVAKENIFSGEYSVYYFNKYILLDILIFTFFQIIGWCILHLLCFIMAESTSNKYLYPFLLLMVSLAASFFVSFLTNFRFQSQWIFTALSPFNLLAPGVISLLGAPSVSARYLTVFSSFILYGLVVFTLYRFVLKRRKKNG